MLFNTYDSTKGLRRLYIRFDRHFMKYLTFFINFFLNYGHGIEFKYFGHNFSNKLKWILMNIFYTHFIHMILCCFFI